MISSIKSCSILADSSLGEVEGKANSVALDCGILSLLRIRFFLSGVG
jgi:hypothetical protein